MKINNKSITRSEFEYAFNKNRTVGSSTPKNINEYLTLFVNNKLKVAEAEAMGFDTTRTFLSELQGYRQQLAKTYLMDRVIDEAYIRKVYDEYVSSRRSGRVLVMHILKYLPQNTSSFEEGKAMMRMDSLYAALKNNPRADFEEYVKKYSEDDRCFGVEWLQTTTEFENVVFSMNSGDISAPFFTPQGIHIVKVFDKKEVRPYTEMREDIKSRLMRRSTVNRSTDVSVEKLKNEYGYVSDDLNISQLFAKGKTDGTLFSINGRTYTGIDFDRFAMSNPGRVKRQFNDFVTKSVLDYADSRLEEKFPEFRLLMQERRDEILLFEINNREVWKEALSDKAGLAAYFSVNKKNYRWEEPRFKGIVLHSKDKKSFKQAKKLLKKEPFEKWTEIIQKRFNTGGVQDVKVEQGVFARGDNAFIDKLVYKKGAFIPMESFPFTDVIGKKIKRPESYKEILEPLTADFQNFLESQWISRLRSTCKVEINEEVIKTVNNH